MFRRTRKEPQPARLKKAVLVSTKIAAQTQRMLDRLLRPNFWGPATHDVTLSTAQVALPTHY